MQITPNTDWSSAASSSFIIQQMLKATETHISFTVLLVLLAVSTEEVISSCLHSPVISSSHQSSAELNILGPFKGHQILPREQTKYTYCDDKTKTKEKSGPSSLCI